MARTRASAATQPDGVKKSDATSATVVYPCLIIEHDRLSPAFVWDSINHPQVGVSVKETGPKETARDGHQSGTLDIETQVFGRLQAEVSYLGGILKRHLGKGGFIVWLRDGPGDHA